MLFNIDLMFISFYILPMFIFIVNHWFSFKTSKLFFEAYVFVLEWYAYFY